MKSSQSQLPSEGDSQSRTTLKQNGVVNFDTKKITFCNACCFRNLFIEKISLKLNLLKNIIVKFRM